MTTLGGMLPERMRLDPSRYHALISAMVKHSAMDRWEGWRLLYNAGFRGPALAVLLINPQGANA